MLAAYAQKCRAQTYTILLTFSLFFVLCIGMGCSTIENSEIKENSVTLDKIPWCNHQKVMVLMDDGATITSKEGTNKDTLTGSPVVLKDWNALKTDLGFRVYLPSGL